MTGLVEVRFTVPGTPVQQGSKQGYVVGSRAVLVDVNKAKLRPWRARVRDAATVCLAGRSGFTDAVAVSIDFHMPRPASVRRDRPSVKPDIDKLVRAILDSLTDSGVIRDDALVVSLLADEWYAPADPFVDVVVGLASRARVVAA